MRWHLGISCPIALDRAGVNWVHSRVWQIIALEYFSLALSWVATGMFGRSNNLRSVQGDPGWERTIVNQRTESLRCVFRVALINHTTHHSYRLGQVKVPLYGKDSGGAIQRGCVFNGKHSRKVLGMRKTERWAARILAEQRV